MPTKPYDATIHKIIDMVFLETGFEREPIREIITCFINHLTTVACTEDVYISKLGSFRSKVDSRRYFDMNDGVTGKRAVKGKVEFKPAKAFVERVEKLNHKEFSEKLNKVNKEYATSKD